MRVLKDQIMFEKILNMYKINNLGTNEICHECKQDSEHERQLGPISSPITPYSVGQNYEDDNFIICLEKSARDT
jgi:hypothetical protein